MTKATKSNILILIINFTIIGINYYDRADMIKEQDDLILRWTELEGVQIAMLAERFPAVEQEEFKKAFKEVIQIKGDKKLKQFWPLKHTEWAAKSIIIDLAIAKDINIGLSAEECIDKLGKQKSISIYDFYNIYEFHIADGTIIKICIETLTKKSFFVTYIYKENPADKAILLGDEYGHCRYIAGGLYHHMIWVNSRMDLILLGN